MSCWYSLDSSHWVLSDRVPICQGISHFPGFLHHFVFAKLATSSIRVNTGDTSLLVKSCSLDIQTHSIIKHNSHMIFIMYNVMKSYQLSPMWQSDWMSRTSYRWTLNSHMAVKMNNIMILWNHFTVNKYTKLFKWYLNTCCALGGLCCLQWSSRCVKSAWTSRHVLSLNTILTWPLEWAEKRPSSGTVVCSRRAVGGGSSSGLKGASSSCCSSKRQRNHFI